jgi:hypothetical protein
LEGKPDRFHVSRKEAKGKKATRKKALSLGKEELK